MFFSEFQVMPSGLTWVSGPTRGVNLQSPRLADDGFFSYGLWVPLWAVPIMPMAQLMLGGAQSPYRQSFASPGVWLKVPAHHGHSGREEEGEDQDSVPKEKATH